MTESEDLLHLFYNRHFDTNRYHSKRSELKDVFMRSGGEICFEDVCKAVLNLSYQNSYPGFVSVKCCLCRRVTCLR